MNKTTTRLVVAMIAFLLVAVVAVPIVQGVINNQSNDISGAKDGKDGKDGEDGITPQLRINYSTNEWEYSYTQGVTWQSLGVKATGAAGKDGRDGQDGKDGADGVNGTNGIDGKDGQDGQDGKDGVSPRIRINTSTSEWEISTDEGLTWESTGVKASGEVVASLTVDSELSATSENPVQNKVIMQALTQFAYDFGTTYTELDNRIDDNSAAIEELREAMAGMDGTSSGGSAVVPAFDLKALGMPVVSFDGSYVTLSVDTTEIRTALEKGSVKFSFDFGVEGNTMTCVVGGIYSPLDDTWVCSYASDMGTKGIFNIYINQQSIAAFISHLDNELPSVSTDDDGKGLIVQDGQWVVGELPETPTQEKTIDITAPGTYEIMPDVGYALSKVIANIDVSGGGGSGGAGSDFVTVTGSFNSGSETMYTVTHNTGLVPVVAWVYSTYGFATHDTMDVLNLAIGIGSAAANDTRNSYRMNWNVYNKMQLQSSAIETITDAVSNIAIHHATDKAITFGGSNCPLRPSTNYTYIIVCAKPAE